MAECFEDFPRREQIEEAITRQSGLHQVEGSVFLFTSISFTCDTTITGWILAGNATGRNNSVYPAIQTWRRSMVGNQFEVDTTTSNFDSSVSMLNTGSLYQYVLDTPVQVLAGDVLGISVPPIDEVDVVPLFNISSIMTVEYFVTSYVQQGLTFFALDNLLEESTLFPLVTPIISGKNEYQWFHDTYTVSYHTGASSPSSMVTTNIPSSFSTATSISQILTTSTMTTSVAITSITNIGTFSQASTLSTSLHTVSPASSFLSQSITTTQLGDTTSSSMSLFPQTNTISTAQDMTSLETSDLLSSSIAQTTSASPTVSITSSVPTSVIAGSVIAAVLVIVIVGLLLVLVFLVVLNKKSKDEGEVAYPPDAYVNAPSPIDNPNYTGEELKKSIDSPK